MDDLTAKLGAWGPIVGGALVFLASLFRNGKTATDEATSFWSNLLNSGRRVSNARQADENETLRQNRASLERSLSELQTDYDHQTRTVAWQRREKQRLTRYCYDAFAEILRLDHRSKFPAPPERSEPPCRADAHPADEGNPS